MKSRIKWLKLVFFATKPCTQHYLVYFIILNGLEPKKIVICLKTRANLRFWDFFQRFWHFLAKSGWNLVCLPRNVYIIVLKWLESKKIFICLKLRATLRFWDFFKKLLVLSRIKWFKLCFFATKHDTQHYFIYFTVLKRLELKTIVVCFKLRAKLHFWGFISVFGTFS